MLYYKKISNFLKVIIILKKVFFKKQITEYENVFAFTLKLSIGVIFSVLV